MMQCSCRSFVTLVFVLIVAAPAGCRETGGGGYFDGGDSGVWADGDVDADADTDVDADTDSDTDTDTDTDADSDGSHVDPAPEVDPDCLDGRYNEGLPNPDASLDDLISSYSSADLLTFIYASLDRRYPLGTYLVASALEDTSIVHCVEAFLGSTANPVDVLNDLSTVVHECGHILDMNASDFSSNTYVINESTRFVCSQGDTDGRGGITFARSLISADAYSDDRPPCGGYPASGCDSYADTYLDGDPYDATFDSGDQGFNFLLDEVVQYVNSLATGYAFHDYLGDYMISERDGLLTFMWYLERYLAMARDGYPGVYALLRDDSCWREAILTVWGRAWLYLTLTDGIGSLGIDDAAIISLVRTPALLQEIELLRQAQGC